MARTPDQVPHVPVMVDRVVQLLRVASGPAVLIDATVGAGGHAAALLSASGPDVHLLGFDRDPEALSIARERLSGFGDRVTLVHGAYDTLSTHVAPVRAMYGPVLGVLYDLGLSSMQLDAPGRGFAFRTDEALDMRMDTSAEEPDAEAMVNGLDEADLAAVIRRYGEERHARRIARAIVAARPVRSTTELADVVRGAVPGVDRHGRIHPATRTFQALRIAVNAELDRFSASLPQALEVAQPADAVSASHGDEPARGGRVAVISYHSLEDRIAKQTFAAARRGCVCPPDLPICACGRTPWVSHLIRGIERPSPQEIAANPRARPAKLRAVEKITAAPTA